MSCLSRIVHLLHRPLESDLTPYSASLCIPAQSVLVLAPHPDDEVFGCGGAIAAHVRAGNAVCVVVLTGGSRFGDVAVRQRESIAAACLLGYGAPEFWSFPDRGLLYSEALVQRLVDKIVQTGADLVYAPSPWEVHPDHRQSQLLAIEAVRRSPSPVRLAFYEVGAPLRPNLLLDITPALETKEAAMRCFASQLVHQDYARHIHALNQYRSYTLEQRVFAAEAFWLLDKNALAQIASIGLLVGVSPGLQRDRLGKPVTMPLVSILIRSMNRGCLVEALDSVALQTYPHIEVVVVAACVDHSPIPAMCGPFPTRLLHTETPLARSQAANKALAQAQGALLLFLDDDDWLMPAHIARLAQTLMGQPHALAAYTGISVVDAQGHPMDQTFDLPFDAVRQMAGNLTPIHAVLFRASVLSEGCRFDETLDLYEDWDFWLQLAKLAPMVHLPGVSGVYRIHDSSGVHSNPGPEGQASTLIYRKWAERWKPKQIGLMMQRVWAHPELQARLNGVEQHLSDTRRQLENTDHELAVARLGLTEAQRLLANSGEQLANTRRLLTESEHSLFDTRNALEFTNRQLTATRQELAESGLQLTASLGRLRDVQERLETAVEVHTQSQAHIAQQQLQIDSQTRDLTATRAELARQQHDYAAILNSSSWQITRPLRRLIVWFRGSLLCRAIRKLRERPER